MNKIVYALIDPRNNQIRYIGEGDKSRPKTHITHAKINRITANSRLTDWIKSLLDIGLEPRIEILNSNLSKSESLLLEKQQIRKLGRIGLDSGGVLFNFADQGTEYDKRGEKNPMFGKKMSAESKQKISIANKGKKRSEEFRVRMSEIAKNRNPMSYETKQKISKNNLGKVVTAEARLKIGETKRKNNVGKFSATLPSGQILFFGSIADFANERGVSSSSIHKLMDKGFVGKRGPLSGWIFNRVPNP